MKHSADMEAILSRTPEIATKLGDPYIGSGHILYSFLSTKDRRIIRFLKRRIGRNIQSALRKLKQSMGPPGIQVIENPANIPISGRFNKVIILAGRRAERRGSKEVRIDDLFWALLADEEGVPACVLGHFGLMLTSEPSRRRGGGGGGKARV